MLSPLFLICCMVLFYNIFVGSGLKVLCFCIKKANRKIFSIGFKPSYYLSVAYRSLSVVIGRYRSLIGRLSVAIIFHLIHNVFVVHFPLCLFFFAFINLLNKFFTFVLPKPKFSLAIAFVI